MQNLKLVITQLDETRCVFKRVKEGSLCLALQLHTCEGMACGEERCCRRQITCRLPLSLPQGRARQPDQREPDHQERAAHGQAVGLRRVLTNWSCGPARAHFTVPPTVLTGRFAICQSFSPFAVMIIGYPLPAHRQLESTRQQLERTKMELRSSKADGVDAWDDYASP